MEGARLFDQVLAIIGDRYVDSLDTGVLYEKAARGLLAELKDPYTELYSPKQLEAFNTTTGGFYAGVGMQIEDQQGTIVVARVFPHTPAEEAGILEGDRIIGVDTSVVRNWRIDQVSSRLKGPPGTKVSAKFARPGVSEPIVVEFTRRTIRIPAVPYGIMLDGKIGYIPVQQFNETATQELVAQLQQLMADGAKGVVLDLRNNPGGFLEQALEMSNVFLPRGVDIVSVRPRVGEPEVHKTRTTPVTATLPLVVLTNEYSASASEIVAGALQDHDRALIVGNTSFGKGLVQSMYRLEDGYAIKLTTAKWYTPSGRAIQKERKLLDDGSFVEVHPDTVETAKTLQDRPRFKSDGGRVVYGGGAIIPDVLVQLDTIDADEQRLGRVLAAKSQDVYVTLYDYAFSLKGKVTPDFTVTPAMRDEFYARLQQKGVSVERTVWDAGQGYVDRILGNRIARLAFGDATAKRREVRDDAQLVKALELLRNRKSPAELFAAAGTPLAAAPVPKR